MSYLTDSLRDTGATTLDCNLLTGSIEDRSQYRNVVTAVGTPTWSASSRGWGLKFNGTSRLVVPASAATKGPRTIAVIADPSAADNRRIISARPGATDIDVYIVLGTIGWYNGVGTANGLAPWLGGAFVLVPGGGCYQTNGAGLSNPAVLASGTLLDYWIGSSAIGASLFYSTSIRRAMLFNRALSSVEAQALLNDLLTERVPTKVYSTQAYVPSGTTRQVVDDYRLDFAPVTFANVTTVNAEIPGITGLRLMSGSVSVKSQPKAIGCTTTATLAGYDTRSRSKRFSFVWTDGTIDVGWASVRGSPTATGQNAYWVQVSSGGALRLAKSVSASESVIATGPTLAAGVEYDAHVSWNSSTGAIKLWYRRVGTSDWMLACEATDTDVTSCSFTVLSLGSSNNKITRRYVSINEASTPWTWG